MSDDSHLTVTAPAPSWFQWALDFPMSEHRVEVEGCSIHYLRWAVEQEQLGQRGVLLVHGGGAHAHWWRYVAPFLARTFNVAAIDLSGMGDSGRRAEYDTSVRAAEIRAVLADAGLGPLPYVIGHSFGGFMTMKFASLYGREIGGAVIVDSPIRSPEEAAKSELPPPPTGGTKKYYPDFDTALGRFRLMPAQSCENDFIVEYIARHSLMETDQGWTWKFDPEAMGARRFGEPFNEYLQAVQCRAALIFGENSALISRETVAYMSELMGPLAPVVEIPEAQHHVMLDQPLAFVASARTLLESWSRG